MYPEFKIIDADASDPWEPVAQMVAKPISEESKRKIFWDNSIGLYRERLLEAVKTAESLVTLQAKGPAKRSWRVL